MIKGGTSRDVTYLVYLAQRHMARKLKGKLVKGKYGTLFLRDGKRKR